MQLLFLLPKGEGQDEGEGDAHFKLCGPKNLDDHFPLTPALSLGALVSTQVAGYSPAAWFLAQKRAFAKSSVLQKVPENGPFLTCV
ncbi:MAG TPA: hypothetical protein VK742_04770, partial [Candidatus Sulfotelmatobacter sp.]|nr:hypothetical protein [Candidatus Sulfotelmatobacter sp.]